MISTLRGEVLEVNSDNLMVNLSGLGLRVYVPSSVWQIAKTPENSFFYIPILWSGRCFDFIRI